MALTAEEIQRIEEEELLRFKTRRTLEVCEELRLVNFQILYRNREAAVNIRCLNCGLLCSVLAIMVFPEEALRWVFPAIAAFYGGVFVCYLLTGIQIAERSIWGAPLEMGSHAEAQWDIILSAAMFASGPILWIRGREYDNFLSVFLVLIAACCALWIASLINNRGLRDRKAASKIRPLEEVFAEAKKRQEAARTSSAAESNKLMSATQRLKPREN